MKNQMIRFLMLGAFLAGMGFFVCVPAQAQDFTAPGWYLIADTIYGPMIDAGPYADEASCTAELPENDGEAEYLCEYLAEAPKWYE